MRLRKSILMCGLAIALAPSVAAAVSFHGLGYLPNHTTASAGLAVSADGTTAVGSSSFFSLETERTQAYRWTAAGGMQGLGDLPGGAQGSFGRGVSADGSVVVGLGSPSGRGKAVRWTAATGMVSIGTLPGDGFSIAEDVSNDGSVVVGTSALQNLGSLNSAFRWTAAGGMVDIGDLPGGATTTDAQAVSADGQFIVGSSASSNGTEAFLWSEAAGMIGLGDLVSSDYMSFARDISDDGTTVVGTRGTGQQGQQQNVQAWRWTASEGMTELNDPTGIFTGRLIATAVSGDGSVIVGYGTSTFGFEDAFIWTATDGMRRLKEVLVSDYGLTEAAAWSLGQPTGISADGRTIVGSGFFGNKDQAWIATIPEPRTALLLATGLLALAGRGRRAA